MCSPPPQQLRGNFSRTTRRSTFYRETKLFIKVRNTNVSVKFQNRLCLDLMWIKDRYSSQIKTFLIITFDPTVFFIIWRLFLKHQNTLYLILLLFCFIRNALTLKMCFYFQSYVTLLLYFIWKHFKFLILLFYFTLKEVFFCWKCVLLKSYNSIFLCYPKWPKILSLFFFVNPMLKEVFLGWNSVFSKSHTSIPFFNPIILNMFSSQTEKQKWQTNKRKKSELMSKLKTWF